VSDHITSGRSAGYRAASESLHRDRGPERQEAAYRMLWACGLGDLIRRDFYGLFEFPEGARGDLLDAGCGSAIEAANLQRLVPGLRISGIDVSSVALSAAVARADKGSTLFYQASLERLPFGDGAFDYIASHEVIEHVEDPGLVLRELCRVLKPGGVCVIATPNGASWWIEHLRQRVMRLFGRRGAPVGADHTRPPSFWRRELGRAGFAVERQIFDGAALEFQMFAAPSAWMPLLSRVFEPLRDLPPVNLLLCDRVKYRLRKPGAGATTPARPAAACCPICHAGLADGDAAIVCGSGHRFARNGLGLVDFSALAPDAAPPPAAEPAATPPAMPTIEEPAQDRRGWVRRLRRAVLLGFSLGYAAFLVALAPLGLILGRFRRPFRP
jgi:SAM-dependent methyltransferase